MNIDSLEMFCLVVEEGSISQAAREMYVTQPAVTRQIRQLEELYNTKLFTRQDGKLIITDAGDILYSFAKAILEEFEHSKEAISQLNSDYHTNLPIGSSFTIGEYFLPKILGKFKKEYPKVNVTLQIGNTPSVIESLQRGEIEVAFVEGIVENNELKIERFASDELILVCSPNHPLRNKKEIEITELSNEKMIWRESISGTRMFVENVLEQFNIFSNIQNYMELGSTQAIKGAVEAGLGISFLPKMAVKRELDYGTLLELEVNELHLKRDLWLVQKVQRFRRDGVEKLIRFIRQFDQEL